MIKRVYDKGGCVGCPTEWGCLGRFCPQCWEIKICCDICGKEVEEVTRIDGTDYCNKCTDGVITHIDYDNADDYINGMDNCSDDEGIMYE